MRQELILIYSFTELPAKTQDTIISSWRYRDQFPWADDYSTTLSTFAALTGTGIGYRDNIEHKAHQDVLDLSGLRARTWLINNLGHIIWKPRYINPGQYSKLFLQRNHCHLTGFCMDESILDPIHKHIDHPDLHTTLKEIYTDCIESWRTAYDHDIEHWHSEEAIREDIEANEHEFTAEGTIF